MPTSLENEFNSHLKQAVMDLEQLHSTLELEHGYLKDADLEAFQALQVRKQHDIQTIQLFDALRNQFCTHMGIDKTDPNFSQHLSLAQQDLWQQLLGLLNRCDTLHRTSDMFMRRKLKSINKALEILELNNPLTSTNLYNELGNAFHASTGRSLDKA